MSSNASSASIHDDDDGDDDVVDPLEERFIGRMSG